MSEKNLTKEQMASSERFALLLGGLPKEKQETVVMMANAFISGMEAQSRLEKNGNAKEVSA